MGYEERIGLFEKIEKIRDTKVISYITSDRPNLSTAIAGDAVDLFVDHLDSLSKYKKLTLILYTRGGNTLAAWRLVNLIRQYFDNYEVIISFKAHSAGTLISIGANNIIMTKQATLSPIDPSINNALNPKVNINGKQVSLPVSVETINGFLAFTKEELSIKGEEGQLKVLEELCKKVNPLVLGQAYRSRYQIRMLAERLLSNHLNDKTKKNNIIEFLTSESGSHDYTIHRKEAKEILGLRIEKPNDELYEIIKNIQNSYNEELEINKVFNPADYLQSKSNYQVKSALIESIEGGSCFYENLYHKTKDNKIINGKKGWKKHV